MSHCTTFDIINDDNGSFLSATKRAAKDRGQSQSAPPRTQNATTRAAKDTELHKAHHQGHTMSKCAPPRTQNLSKKILTDDIIFKLVRVQYSSYQNAYQSGSYLCLSMKATSLFIDLFDRQTTNTITIHDKIENVDYMRYIRVYCC
jgi:hypothetical protein